MNQKIKTKLGIFTFEINYFHFFNKIFAEVKMNKALEQRFIQCFRSGNIISLQVQCLEAFSINEIQCLQIFYCVIDQSQLFQINESGSREVFDNIFA